jgi:MFS transporter, CP family, cyanate transporter
VFYVIVAWLPSIEQHHGVAATTAGWHLFAYLISAVAANLLAPVVMRRLPDQRLAGLLAGGLILLGVAGLLATPAAALPWMISAGLGAGLSLVLCLSLFSLRTINFGQAAALSGMAQSIGYAMAACGPILLGWLRDASGSWTLPLAVLTCLAVALCVVAQLAGRSRTIE